MLMKLVGLPNRVKSLGSFFYVYTHSSLAPEEKPSTQPSYSLGSHAEIYFCMKSQLCMENIYPNISTIYMHTQRRPSVE